MCPDTSFRRTMLNITRWNVESTSGLQASRLMSNSLRWTIGLCTRPTLHASGTSMRTPRSTSFSTRFAQGCIMLEGIQSSCFHISRTLNYCTDSTPVRNRSLLLSRRLYRQARSLLPSKSMKTIRIPRRMEKMATSNNLTVEILI